jgi:hypothetical protein
MAGGAVAGTLDIVYAWGFWRLKAGVSMLRILQSVAAGVLGSRSYVGGGDTALLGLALHYFIATTMSIAYYLAAIWWPALARYPLRYGALYGLLLYGTMRYIVVPLSAAGRQSTDPLWVALSVAVHVVFIGIPIAAATHYAFRARIGDRDEGHRRRRRDGLIWEPR